MESQDDEKTLASSSPIDATTTSYPKDPEKALDRQPTLQSLNSPVSSTHSTLHSVADEDDGNMEAGDHELDRTTSPVIEAVKVPRARRRGLFGRYAIVAEVVDPRTYSRRLKWFITFIVAVCAMAAPLGSAILFPSLYQVSDELHASPTITNLTVALYMLSMAIFPLWWSAFSETFGRRTIYLVSFALFIFFTVLSAVSNSIGMLAVMRMLSGGASASVQAVGAGTISDLWLPKERGRAMGFFYLGPLCGPLFAPIIGGALAQRWNWRATMWFLTIYGGITWVLIFTALPETLKSMNDLSQEADAEEAVAEAEPTSAGDAAPSTLSRVSTKQSIGKHAKKWGRMVRMVVLDPLKVILYLRFPAVLLTAYYASITFGSLYVLNISIQDTFAKPPYNYSSLIVGLLYIPPSIGYMIVSIFGGRWMDNIMRREAIKAGRYDEDGKLVYRPEDRMRENAWLGAVLYPAALIWYGWTAEKGIYWIVPIIALIFFGIGCMLIFGMATTMLTEFMPRKSSSGIAVNNLMRNVFSCVGGIVAAPIIQAIGNGWLFTILGLWALSSCTVIWAMRHFGPRWRETMDRELK